MENSEYAAISRDEARELVKLASDKLEDLFSGKLAYSLVVLRPQPCDERDIFAGVLSSFHKPSDIADMLEAGIRSIGKFLSGKSLSPLKEQGELYEKQLSRCSDRVR